MELRSLAGSLTLLVNENVVHQRALSIKKINNGICIIIITYYIDSGKHNLTIYDRIIMKNFAEWPRRDLPARTVS